MKRSLFWGYLGIQDYEHTGLWDCAELQARDLNEPVTFGVQLT